MRRYGDGVGRSCAAGRCPRRQRGAGRRSNERVRVVDNGVEEDRRFPGGIGAARDRSTGHPPIRQPGSADPPTEQRPEDGTDPCPVR
jgi:hypothetical protein